MRKRFICLGVALGLLSFLFMAIERSSTAQTQPMLEIFMEEDFQGPSLILEHSLIDMPVLKDQNGVEINWNDHVGSIIVYGGTFLLTEQS